MCFGSAMGDMKDMATDSSTTTDETPSPADILNAGLKGASSTGMPKQSGVSKVANNPILQGGAGAAGVALAPATAGLSMLIPVATKLIGGLLAKKPKRTFGPPQVGNTDAGLTDLASRSFGGM